MMGMGTLEVLVILLVAFVFLGPEKMIEGAKLLGSLFTQARNTMDDVTNIDLDSFSKKDSLDTENADTPNDLKEEKPNTMADPIPFGRKVQVYSEEDIESDKKDA
jgi:Sec-independent protein translocase protein TatA|tara:strand:+ start:325 stop:639 length:315 start_codon:yes stop_codon:yes gene_type:complete